MTKFAGGLLGVGMLMAGVIAMPARSAAENASPITDLTLVSLETVTAPDAPDRGDRAWAEHPMVKVTFTATADLGAIEQIHKRSVHVTLMTVQEERYYTHDTGGAAPFYNGATLYNASGRVTGPDTAGVQAGSVVHNYHFYIGLIPQRFSPIVGNARDSIVRSDLNGTEPSFKIAAHDFLKPMGFKFLGVQGNSNFVRLPEEEFKAAVKAGAP